MAEITTEKKRMVQESWGLVKGNMRTNASDFFLFFFKRHPTYQKLFKDFKDVKYSELEENQKFRGHAVRVFFAISSLVDNLDDLDIVVDILQKTVKDHTPRGIKAKHYEDLFATVLAFLEKALADKFSPACKGSWETVAGVVLSVIHSTLEPEMTPDDKERVQGSWKLVRGDMRKHAMGFFAFFFKRHPDYQQLFQDFKDVDVEDLPKSSKFRGHAVRVFTAISSLIDNLDDLDIVVTILQKTVEGHYPRGIRSYHFEDLFATILAFLENTLGAHYDEDTRQSWELTSRVVLSVVNSELDNIGLQK